VESDGNVLPKMLICCEKKNVMDSFLKKESLFFRKLEIAKWQAMGCC
jgi:hypothetical protein